MKSMLLLHRALGPSLSEAVSWVVRLEAAHHDGEINDRRTAFDLEPAGASGLSSALDRVDGLAHRLLHDGRGPGLAHVVAHSLPAHRVAVAHRGEPAVLRARTP